ncbi:hypothetical protein CARUB_v10007234mg [Capsella rubella]|uniref:DYW domain-containing protein n=1 Tax=Capsella rubella TaxID=81985 RepID=R0H542_9BRAS|nr:hypothetical protein CARUB_v10007234mg [Capsella rubella]
MSALSVIEQRLLKWNKVASLLPKPNKPLIPIDRLNELLKLSRVKDVFQINSLINLYVKCGETVRARKLFDLMPERNVVSCSALSGYLECGAFKEGVDVLRRMAYEDLVWDNITYLSSLRLCSNLRDLDLGLQIHSRMIRFGFSCEVEATGALINMYGKCGNVIYAQRVYDDTHAQNIVLNTTIMDAYFQDKSFEEALNLFAKMGTKDVPPNEFTFAILLNSIAELSLLKQGDLLHGLVLKSGYKNHLMVGNALVNMYAKSGSIVDARKTFSGMAFRDIITWNTLICGFSHHGLGKEALEAFDRMMYAGEFPNRITFIVILQACCHTGFVERGLYYFDQLMKQFDVQPDLQHYTCIVGLLSKAGLFEKAENFMRTALIEWDVAEYAMEKHPKDSGIYILLSNIHARSREWEGVANVRSLMNKRGVKKDPGVSWIGIRNQTHVFLAEESQHPEIMLIYAKVKEVLSKIRPLGYSPDVAGDFHDIDEEEREDNLSYHSEKLAVAYGLMKTPENSPLYVTKNVRICDDCHFAIKLISKVSKRYIVIRDSH